MVHSRLARWLWLALVGVLLGAAPAAAHPHVMVTSRSEIVFAADGSITGVRHVWTFDDMYSSYAVMGLDQKEKGKFTREELAALAEVNVTSLEEYKYFTYARVDGKRQKFGKPTDYFLDYADGALILHFTLPLVQPVKTAALDFEVYDPDYFVAFTFEKNDPVTLAQAPAGCRIAIHRPAEDAQAKALALGDEFFNTQGKSWGAQYANKAEIRCP